MPQERMYHTSLQQVVRLDHFPLSSLPKVLQPGKGPELDYSECALMLKYQTGVSVDIHVNG
jgi:hypothetical protein